MSDIKNHCYKEITYICKQTNKEAKYYGSVRLLKYSGWSKGIISIKNIEDGKI